MERYIYINIERERLKDKKYKYYTLQDIIKQI
jgi:hypothetical protein